MSNWRKRQLMKGLAPSPLQTLSVPSIADDPSHNEQLFVTNLRYVASYDVVDRSTIIVPGSPRIWSPPETLPFAVKADTRELATERNAYKLGSPMFESVFAATDALGTPIAWPAVDLVTNRRALRHLQRWVAGSNNSARDDFRIDVDRLGARTMLFGEHARTFQFDDRHASYGHGFEEDTTDAVPGCEASIGHHRVVNYTFGGLNMVVRFETDARVDAPGGATGTTEPPFRPSRSAPIVIRAGEIVDQAAIVEIKSTKTPGGGAQTWPARKWADAAPQLLLSGTPRLHTGMHIGGRFAVMEEHACDEETLLARAPRVAGSMRRLGTLLQLIQGALLARGKGARGLSIVCESGQLRLYERVARGQGMLADEFKARFDTVRS